MHRRSLSPVRDITSPFKRSMQLPLDTAQPAHGWKERIAAENHPRTRPVMVKENFLAHRSSSGAPTQEVSPLRAAALAQQQHPLPMSAQQLQHYESYKRAGGVAPPGHSPSRNEVYASAFASTRGPAQQQQQHAYPTTQSVVADASRQLRASPSAAQLGAARAPQGAGLQPLTHSPAPMQQQPQHRSMNHSASEPSFSSPSQRRTYAACVADSLKPDAHPTSPPRGQMLPSLGSPPRSGAGSGSGSSYPSRYFNPSSKAFMHPEADVAFQQGAGQGNRTNDSAGVRASFEESQRQEGAEQQRQQTPHESQEPQQVQQQAPEQQEPEEETEEQLALRRQREEEEEAYRRYVEQQEQQRQQQQQFEQQQQMQQQQMQMQHQQYYGQQQQQGGYSSPPRQLAPVQSYSGLPPPGQYVSPPRNPPTLPPGVGVLPSGSVSQQARVQARQKTVGPFLQRHAHLAPAAGARSPLQQTAGAEGARSPNRITQNFLVHEGQTAEEAWYSSLANSDYDVKWDSYTGPRETLQHVFRDETENRANYRAPHEQPQKHYPPGLDMPQHHTRFPALNSPPRIM